MSGHIADAGSVHWRTPRKILDAVDRVFGGPPELDPCSNPWSLTGARVQYMLPNNDGLVDSWDYRTIFMNPPYGKAWYRTKPDGRREYIWLDEYKTLHPRARQDIKKVDIRDWVGRCAEANQLYGSEVIALIPAYVDTRAWQEIVWKTATAVCFPRGRVKFLMPPDANGVEKSGPAPMATAVIHWAQPFHSGKFEHAFEGLGKTILL